MLTETLGTSACKPATRIQPQIPSWNTDEGSSLGKPSCACHPRLVAHQSVQLPAGWAFSSDKDEVDGLVVFVPPALACRTRPVEFAPSARNRRSRYSTVPSSYHTSMYSLHTGFGIERDCRTAGSA